MSMTSQSLDQSIPQYTFQSILGSSERVNWNVSDIIGGDKRLNFAKNFMPESLARTSELTFLSPTEQRTLNQIKGHSYLCIFGLVEEFILPFVLDHARPQLDGGDYRVRALLSFANEEAKHIHLFKRFRDEFESDFGCSCDVIGPPAAIAKEVLSHHPLAVALTILHIEWMTQRHYTDSVKDNEQLDDQFKSLLKHHWMEEAQHAKIDTLMVAAIADTCSAGEISNAVDEYLEIGGFLDGGVKAQVEFEMASFMRASGRVLSMEERDAFMTSQHQASRWTFLGSGMTHKNFLASLERLSPEARTKVEQVAPAFS